jgi:hypothetical protein
MSISWGGDPAMWARDFTNDVTTNPAQKYIEAGLRPFVPGKKGDTAFDDVLDLLDFRTNFMTKRRTARLYVFENCAQTIHMMQTVTWNDIRHGRHKWVVDMADALKLMCSVIPMQLTQTDPNNMQMPTSGRTYTNDFIY